MGTIVTRKVTSPSGSEQLFTFTPSWGVPFTLRGGQSNDSGVLADGVYSISEAPAAGWTTGVSVSSGDPPSAIRLGSAITNPLQQAVGNGSATFPNLTQPGSSILVFTATNNGSSSKAPQDDQGNEYNQIQSGFWSNGPSQGTIWYAPATTFINAAGVRTVTVPVDTGDPLMVWIMEVSSLQAAGNAPIDFDGGNFGGPDSLPVGTLGLGNIGQGSNFPNPAGDICVALAVVGSATVVSVDAPWILGAVQNGNAIAYRFANNGDPAPAPQFRTDVDCVWAIAQAYFLAESSTIPSSVTVTFTNSKPVECAPVDSQGNLTAGVEVGDLGLFIGPATALYDTYLTPPQVNSYETQGEGRREIVLDFNHSDGIYARDLGTVFSWALIRQGKPKTVLFAWQPSVIAMPEGIYGRASDWMDGGTPGAKYIQGIMVEADSFGNQKQFFLQDSDTLQFHTLNEVPAIFSKQTAKAFSCQSPFVAHSARLISSDGVEWRVWSTNLVFEPWPELCRNWQAEMTSLELTGWGHVREMNIPHVSTADLTLVLTFDSWPTITLTIPNSGGRQVKQKVTLPANKFKLMQPRIYSTETFRLFEKDLELKIKSWGSYDFYRISKPFGGPSREGALV